MSEFVKAYDVRGLVPQQLNPAVCAALGSAFAQAVVLPDGAGRIVLGHDMRPSSPDLAQAFAAGVAGHGIDVEIIGLCSTDGLYYASGADRVPGAMFTASHNPAQYNGIKLCRSMARPVGLDSGLAEVRDLTQELLERGADGIGSGAGAITQRDRLADYSRHLRALADLSHIRPLVVVVDAGNGMAGLTAPAVLGTAAGLPALPLRVIPLFFELDGTFPNHEANPLEPENLRDLQAAVVEHGADLGLAFDGDADRCFVVDERGAAVSPSTITALVASREIQEERSHGRSATVVYNVISSRAVPEVIAEAGGHGVRTRVGHSFIKGEMARHNAVFGGEHSAHYYFRDFWFADTGMLAALYVLKELGEQQGPLSSLVASYQRYAASGEINSTVADVAAATARVREWAARQDVVTDDLDGFTATHDPDEPTDEPTDEARPRDRMWWFNLRASNTEPLLRLNVEAADAATMARVRDDVLSVVRAEG